MQKEDPLPPSAEIEPGRRLPTYDGCIVCGSPHVNAATLGLKFTTDEQGVHVECVPSEMYAGYKGVVHGGIICALLDETIGWSVAVVRKKYFVTGELTVRFLRPLPVGLRITVRGRPVSHHERYSVAEGEIIGPDGKVYAEAIGKFYVMRDDKARQVREYLTFAPGDWDFLGE
ncbi:MAG: PaaI family thioesterase [candidate division KSB1 bacterium]|nr:PaaI family thioesterase [candidate division KSB1 bacterium]